MEVEDSFIEGLKILHLKKIGDNRGTFVKLYNDDFFILNNLRTDFKESYFSVSHKNALRGMHFQIPPAEHTKLVFVNKGSIQDVILDIRKNSSTYGQYLSVKISEGEPKLIYIPTGCAHGFLSLEDNTIVSYIQTSVYNKDCDSGISYNSFGMDWGLSNPIISDRDKRFLGIDEFINPFQ